MANLHPVFVSQKQIELLRCEVSVGSGQLAKLDQFIIVDVPAVLLRKQVLVNPERPGIREEDRAVSILFQALLENATPKIVDLPA